MWKLLIGALAFAWAGICFYVPDKVVVDRTGNVSGLRRVQVLIQGDKFWRGQNEAARRELQRRFEQPHEQARFESKIQKIDEQVDRDYAALCAKNRDFCTPPKSPSEILHEKADALEEKEFKQDVELHRQRRIDELRGIIAITETRIK